MGDAHTPCSCQQWSQWMTKISEVKPDKIRETTAEYEEAANSLWLVTYSKPCPNCNSPIQKNEGCNHMKCSKVNFLNTHLYFFLNTKQIFNLYLRYINQFLSKSNFYRFSLKIISFKNKLNLACYS